MSGVAELLAQRSERRRLAVIAVDVAQPLAQLRERVCVDAVLALLQAVANPRLEPLEVETERATPTTGTVSVPCLSIDWSAG